MEMHFLLFCDYIFLYRMLEVGTLAYSDDPDVLQHCAALHLGMHYLINLKQPSGQKYVVFRKITTDDPFKNT